MSYTESIAAFSAVADRIRRADDDERAGITDTNSPLMRDVLRLLSEAGASLAEVESVMQRLRCIAVTADPPTPEELAREHMARLALAERVNVKVWGVSNPFDRELLRLRRRAEEELAEHSQPEDA